MMSNRRARQGFTLFELLTVLAVLSVVTTIGVTGFVRMTSLWSNTTADMEANVIAVRIFETIRGDMERVVSARRTGHSIQGIDQLELDKLIARHKPEDDRVILPVLEHNVTNGAWRQLAVMYHINRNDGVPTLMRTLGPSYGSVPGGASTVVAERVPSMNITYLNAENRWEDAWTQNDLPQAIRVSLTLGLSNRPDKTISREAVFPIHVK